MIVSSPRQQLLKVINDLAHVRASAQQLATDYQACSKRATDSVADIGASRTPLGKCLADDTIKVVAADGATVRKKVKDTVVRLRDNETRLATLIGQADNIIYPLAGDDQELQKLSLELASQPAVAALLDQSRQLIQIGGLQHQGAARSAGWARSSAMMAENEFSQCGNQMNNVCGDAPGKNVAGEAGLVKFRVDRGDSHLRKQSEHTTSTVGYENTALQAFQDAQGRLTQAWQQLPPDPPNKMLLRVEFLDHPQLDLHNRTTLAMVTLASEIMESDRQG